MNDHRPPPDELASAFLDGELTAAGADAVRQDPELVERARALQRAAEAVGETVTPPPGAADAAVEAALADFDDRLRAPADMTRRRSRGLAVIAGVAAAVAAGFIVAAAVGLFAEREAVNEMATAPPAPAPEPAAEAPEPPPSPPPAEMDDMAAAAAEPMPPPATIGRLPAAPAEPPVVALHPPGEPADAPADTEPEAALAEAQATAEEARAEAAAAVAELDTAGAAPQPESEEAAAPAPAPEPAPAAPAPPPPPRDMAADDMAADDMAADDMDPSPQEACGAAIGDRAVQLRFSHSGAPVLILQSADGTLTALDGTSCAELPPEDGSEMIADPAPDGCSDAIGHRTVELRLALRGTLIVILRSADGTLTALDGTSCAQLPPL